MEVCGERRKGRRCQVNLQGVFSFGSAQGKDVVVLNLSMGGSWVARTISLSPRFSDSSSDSVSSNPTGRCSLRNRSLGKRLRLRCAILRIACR